MKDRCLGWRHNLPIYAKLKNPGRSYCAVSTRSRDQKKNSFSPTKGGKGRTDRVVDGLHDWSHIFFRKFQSRISGLGECAIFALPGLLRRALFQLHMTDTCGTASTFNADIVALRFFFSMTYGREEMKRFIQFRRPSRKLPIVSSIEEVSDL